MNATHDRRWLALVALGLSLLAVGLDMTVLNTALPTLATDLDASTTDLQWFVAGYNLVLAAAVLPAGLLGDRWGRRRMLTVGLLVFGAGSAWCALASSSAELISARAVLGLGAALLLPLSISMITVLFEPAERPRAIAAISGFQMVGIPLGPIIAGTMLQHLAWGWVFVINVPLALMALLATRILMPETRGQAAPIDALGIAVSSAGLVALTYGLIEGPSQGWTTPQVLGSVLGGAALLVVLAAVERRVAHPLLDLSLFRSRGFTSGTVTATIVTFAMFGTMFVLPQLFQAVEGADALGTGLRSLPMVAGVIVGLQLAKRMASRPGVTVTLIVGFAAIALGSLIGTRTGPQSGFGFVAAWSAVVGLGLGLNLPTAMTVALNALSPLRAGIGSAMLLALRQFGSVLGVAVLGSVLAAAYSAGLPPDTSPAVGVSPTAGVAVAEHLNAPDLLDQVRTAFTGGLALTLWICAAVAALGIVLTVLMREQPTAQAPSPAIDTEPANADLASRS